MRAGGAGRAGAPQAGVRKERSAMAGEMRQEWTWRDIFRSIGLAFSFTRLMIGFLGLAVFAAADGLTTWGMIAAEDAGVAGGSWAMRGIICGRWIVAGYIFLFTAAAIAYSAKGELLEGEGAGIKESICFVFRKFGALFWTPVLFWVFVAVMGGIGFVFFMLPALVARLAGWTLLVSLIWYTLSFFFIVLFAMLAMLGVLAFLFSLFLAPPIIATRQEGALDATLDSIDLMRGKGAFWVAILVLMVSAFIGVGVLGKTMDVTYRVSNVVVGEDFPKTVAAMPEEIKPRSRTIMEAATMYWPGEYRTTVAGLAKRRGRIIRPRPRGLEKNIRAARTAVGEPSSLPTRYRVAGWILGIWVLIVAGFLVSFTVGTVVAASTLTYLIVREEDEFLEPSTVEVPPVARPAAKPEEEAKKEQKSEGKREDGKEEDKKVEKKEKKGGKSKRSKRKKSG